MGTDNDGRGHVSVEHVTKRYGAVTALDDVSAEFFPGEIHAVLGENGAGKSTLVAVLAGFAVPQAGTATVGGKHLPFGDARASRALGIRMVHQHFTLVPAFTVAENLALDQAPSLTAGISVEELAGDALEMARRLNWEFDPAAEISTLSVGLRQRLEIVKALRGDCTVAIFDEPTTVLHDHEVEDLFRVLRDLRSSGKTIILIAHKLQEVMAVADRVTVLRAGRKVASAPIKAVTERQLAEWMVGEMPSLGQTTRHESFGAGIEAKELYVQGDRGERAIRGVSFSIARGEVLGFGGVDGNGQVELAEALAGVRRVRSGDTYWLGQRIDPRELSLAYIPQDRQRDGLALELSVLDNLLVEGHRDRQLAAGPFLRRGRARNWASDVVRRFEVRTRSLDTSAKSLSGGNQQKLVVGRALASPPQLLIAVNPTRGLDIRASEYVLEQIRAAKSAGCAVALFSTDLDELAAIADRTVFMSRGQLAEGYTQLAVIGGQPS